MCSSGALCFPEVQRRLADSMESVLQRLGAAEEAQLRRLARLRAVLFALMAVYCTTVERRIYQKKQRKKVAARTLTRRDSLLPKSLPPLIHIPTNTMRHTHTHTHARAAHTIVTAHTRLQLYDEMDSEGPARVLAKATTHALMCETC